MSDEDEILPPKLQAALVQILEDRDEVLAQEQQFSQGVRAGLGVGGEGSAHTTDPALAHCVPKELKTKSLDSHALPY